MYKIYSQSNFSFHKVGWYNAHVKPGFCLEHHKDTLAFIVISSPSFFERGFLPFVRNSVENSINQDYLDQALRSCLTRAIQVFLFLKHKSICHHTEFPVISRSHNGCTVWLWNETRNTKTKSSCTNGWSCLRSCLLLPEDRYYGSTLASW